MIKALCVFCGSNPGKAHIYLEQASLLGQEAAARGIGIVYGGASIGVMAAVANAALAAGGSVVGVIPKILFAKEVAHKGLTELHTVNSMHERKMLMFERSDAFVAIPGGFGTLDEIFEIITWKQIGFHNKPVFFLNTNGYFDALMAFVDRAIADDFVREEHRKFFSVVSTVQELFEKL